MRRLGATLILLSAACGGLTETDDGVAFLDVQRPASTTLEVGETLQLVALALDARGEPVDAPIQWVSPDDFLAVDAETGLVTALAAGTNGRVQASTGAPPRQLFSDPVVLTVVEPPPPPPPPPAPLPPEPPR